MEKILFNGAPYLTGISGGAVLPSLSERTAATPLRMHRKANIQLADLQHATKYKVHDKFKNAVTS